jgi:hypothetical protein
MWTHVDTEEPALSVEFMQRNVKRFILTSMSSTRKVLQEVFVRMPNLVYLETILDPHGIMDESTENALHDVLHLPELKKVILPKRVMTPMITETLSRLGLDH